MIRFRFLAAAALTVAALCSTSLAARQQDCTQGGCHADHFEYAAVSVPDPDLIECHVAVRFTVIGVNGHCVDLDPGPLKNCFGSPCEFLVNGDYMSCCDTNRLHYACNLSQLDTPEPPSCGFWANFYHESFQVRCKGYVVCSATLASPNESAKASAILSCSDCR